MVIMIASNYACNHDWIIAWTPVPPPWGVEGVCQNSHGVDGWGLRCLRTSYCITQVLIIPLPPHLHINDKSFNR